MSYPPSSDRSGVVYNANNGQAVWLPLDSLNVHAFILDLSARVVLSQVYLNTGTESLKEAYYVFPIPARAAVCSFEAVTSDGKRLEAKVKELSQAKQDYEDAIRENRLATLLEQFRMDIFALSIGWIPAQTTFTVTVQYVVDLEDDDIDNSVRFQLSSAVRGRYGAPASSILYTIPGTTHRARLCITVDIQMTSHILGITSVHHPLTDIPLTPSSFTKCRKQFLSNDIGLEDDFVLIIQALDLDQPRCLSETITFPDGSCGSALALTVVPNFQLKYSPSTAREFLFLIDRSGSMSGNRIYMAKEALRSLVKTIPSGSKFNICGFGSSYEVWHHGTNPIYGPETLSLALQYIDSMDANLGGTEIFSAFVHLISCRDASIPTALFVLTDGEVYNPNDIILYAQGAVQTSSPHASLRICSLAVGSGASMELCEGLAAAGGGICLSTIDGEYLMRKAMRLLEAMETPDVQALEVDWSTTGVVKQSPPTFRIYPNKRLFITAILAQNQPPPTYVTLRGQAMDGSMALEYKVAVHPTLSTPTDAVETAIGHPVKLPPLVHTLAAHRLVIDLERGIYHPPGTAHDLDQTIINLGLRYQIATSKTAFVAVWVEHSRQNSQSSNRNTPSQSSRSMHTARSTRTPRTTSTAKKQTTKSAASSKTKSPSRSSVGGFGTANGSPDGSKANQHCPNGQPSSREPGDPTSSACSTPRPPGAYPPSPSSPRHIIVMQQSNSQRSEELLYLFDGKAPPVLLRAPPLNQDTVIISLWRSIRSIIFRKSSGSVQQQSIFNGQMHSSFNRQSAEDDDPAFQRDFSILTQLQTAEKLYQSSQQLITSLNMQWRGTLPAAPPTQLQGFGDESEAIWATALAVAYLMKKYPLQWSTWARFSRKMREAGALACGSNEALFSEVVQYAYNNL